MQIATLTTSVSGVTVNNSSLMTSRTFTLAASLSSTNGREWKRCRHQQDRSALRETPHGLRSRTDDPHSPWRQS